MNCLLVILTPTLVPVDVLPTGRVTVMLVATLSYGFIVVDSPLDLRWLPQATHTGVYACVMSPFTETFAVFRGYISISFF